MATRIVVRLLVSLMATVQLSCIHFEPQSKQVPETFGEVLGICRMQQPGRVNRRVHLPPEHAGVARCLRRRGWNPDGSPILQKSHMTTSTTLAVSRQCCSCSQGGPAVAYNAVSLGHVPCFD